MRNQIFISYRHESPEHAEAVRRLGLSLRERNLPVVLDQFFLLENPGGPDKGWPQWCQDSANESQCVLIVASVGWFEAYKGSPELGGLGAASEACLLLQDVYNHKGQNSRIRLVFLPGMSSDEIPPEWQRWHHFRPFDRAEDYQQLILWAQQRLNIQSCYSIGQDIQSAVSDWPAKREFKPEIANRNEAEWPAIVDLLTGRSRERILFIEGGSGVGKSELIRQAKVYGGMLGVLIAEVDFKGGLVKLHDIFMKLRLDVGSRHLPSFSRDGWRDPYLLREDLRKLSQPLLVLFDTYEQTADNRDVVGLLEQHILPEVEMSHKLAVIICGQRVPEPTHAKWSHLARTFVLKPIKDFDAWDEWVSRRYPSFQGKGDLRTLILVTGGLPGTMSTYCAKVADA